MKTLTNRIKTSAKGLLAFGFISAIAATNVSGQFLPPITVDEWGGAIGLPPGFLAPDPTGGIPPALSPVLMYTLPSAVMSGDVLLLEPGTNTAPYSDVIRFINNTALPNQSLLIFYSDRPESGEIPPPADTGLPNQLLPVVAVTPEIGTEAFNYATYLATPGMPGWDGNPLGTSYTFISDGVVPEPSSFSLAIMGGGFLLFLKQRFQMRRK